jgi:hypothetical protein
MREKDVLCIIHVNNYQSIYVSSEYEGCQEFAIQESPYKSSCTSYSTPSRVYSTAQAYVYLASLLSAIVDVHVVFLGWLCYLPPAFARGLLRSSTQALVVSTRDPHLPWA